MNLLPPDQAAELLRKKRFWKRSMWISLAAGVVFALLAVGGSVLNMIRAFATLEKFGSAEPSAPAIEIAQALLIRMYSDPLACLAFLLAMVSFIRLLNLPKSPKT